MGGFFGVASKEDSVFDLFFGIDYHSHLGTRRGGMAVYGEDGFNRSIHNIENSPFRTKFDKDIQTMKGKYGIGCISDYEPQPLIVRSHHGTYALTTVSKINNMDELTKMLFDKGHSHFQEMSGGEINATELVAALINQKDNLIEGMNYALEKNGFPKRTLEEVTKFVGNGIRKLIVRAVPKGTDEHMTDVVFEDFKEYYGKHCADKTEKYPGIDYVLDSLHKERCRTAVISNKADYAVKILCDDFFPGKFDAVYGERESMGIKKKPDPQAVLAVLDEFKTDRKDAVYIGDSEVDIATAKNAGVDGIIVSWGFREKEILIQNGAECIVDTSQELVDKILG